MRTGSRDESDDVVIFLDGRDARAMWFGERDMVSYCFGCRVKADVSGMRVPWFVCL